MRNAMASSPGAPSRKLVGLLRGLVFALVLGSFTGACSDDKQPVVAVEDDGVINILFIGNSLTYVNNLPDILLAMLETADVGRVEIEMLALPNWGLQDLVLPVSRNLIEYDH